ncbi:MAG: GNAT family N-acetyltransferase [Pirellulales bacterium]
MSTLEVSPARPDQAAEALRLIFGPHLNAAYAQTLAGESTPATELICATRAGAVVGAACVQIQPGGAAAVYPPALVAGEPAATADALLAAAIDRARCRGATFAQALLETDAGPLAESFERFGFRRLTELLYLVSEADTFPVSQPKCEIALVPYTDADRGRLASIVELTYEQTLDCPELNGRRRAADVLAGYAATGAARTDHWYLLARGDIDVGCLLLADHPSDNQWELVYVGLVPAVRGRGWGLQATRHAQWLTRNAGRRRLVLAVDGANSPAIAIYVECGFRAWDRRSVFVKDLSRP